MSIEPYTGSSRHRVTRHHGFTLVELMVTVAIVAILASIAYPSYQQYVIRSNRSLAQQFMLDVANREEEYLLNNRHYGSLTDLGLTLPGQLTKLYSITATPKNSDAPIGYQITATPVIGISQSSDGALTLDHLGNRTPLDKW